MKPATKKALKILAAGALALLFFHHARGDDIRDKVTPETPRTNLTIRLTDVFGEALQSGARIEICHRSLPVCLDAETTAPEITINNLPAGLKTPYEIEVSAPSYEKIVTTASLAADQPGRIHAVMRVNTRQVGNIVFKPYDDLPASWRALLERSPRVESYEGKHGKELYESLKDSDKALVLNIMAKTQATALLDGSNILDHIHEISVIKPDRVITVSSPALKQQIETSSGDGKTFNKRSSLASGFHDPPPGYKKAGGFKTPDAKGTLDIELYENNDSLIAELDIDEDRGLAHTKEIVRNIVKGQYTSPLKIAQILAEYQNIDPLYRPTIRTDKDRISPTSPTAIATPPRLR